MYTFLFAIFLLVCLLLTITILLQSSKGGGLAGAFGGGGGGMGAVFGGRGAATFLSKLTTVLAALFLLLAFALSKMKSGTTQDAESLVARQRAEQTANPVSILPPVEQSVPAVQNAQDTQQPAKSDSAQ